MTEKDLEQMCVNAARRAGWDAWKNEDNGNKGIPDHSFLHPDGRFVMVEFKRPDGRGRVSREQRVWIERHPGVVSVCDNFEDFCNTLKINKYEKKQQ